jgi:hypothetical protein
VIFISALGAFSSFFYIFNFLLSIENIGRAYIRHSAESTWRCGNSWTGEGKKEGKR